MTDNLSKGMLLESASDNDAKLTSLILALFENFKFNYESLGKLPRPLDASDVHPYDYLKHFDAYTRKDHYFEEKNHVHFNSFIAYNKPFTAYPMKSAAACHHFTLEQYQYLWGSALFDISDWKETAPLIFSVDNNYFMESCNAAFLLDDRYLDPNSYPASHSLHKNCYSEDMFKKMRVPRSLLMKSFQLEGVEMPDDSIRTLNFCLRIFHVSYSILCALDELFGNNNDQALRHIDQWRYPHGEKIRKVPLFKLNILSFLYLSMHPMATALCYGLYRNKYGIDQTHRTMFYVRTREDYFPLKDFLLSKAKEYLAATNLQLNHADNDRAKKIRKKTIACLDLLRMFGCGYSTDNLKGKNTHINSPVDLEPEIKHPVLDDVDFVVQHDERSPLWRIFYDYCGQWWDIEEISRVISGKTDYLSKNSTLRNLAVNMMSNNAAHYWKDLGQREPSGSSEYLNNNVLTAKKILETTG